MKFLAFLALACVAATVSAQGLPPGFNLTQFMNQEGIDPNTIVMTNCLPIGSPCSGSAMPCCLSPVWVCQPSNKSNVNTCSVVPPHRVHIPIIRELFSTFNVTTQNPIY